MDNWREERAREIRTALQHGDEGSLWVVFFDDPRGAPLLAAPLEGAMGKIDRQFTVNLAMLINEVGSRAVLIAIPRSQGAPVESDYRLWRQLRELLAPSPIDLLDLLVVGPRSAWSVREASTPPGHHCPAACACRSR